MKFSEVIGQQQVAERLRQLADQQRVPHAIMICGPQGAGKMALAIAFASYLLGEREDETQIADKERNSVAMVRKLEHPDLHFSFPVFKTKSMSADHKVTSDDFMKDWLQFIKQGPYFTLNQWTGTIGVENQQTKIYVGESDLLTRKLSLTASQGGYKVAIIWLPEKMNAECANKMLKLLEEPTPRTVFILVPEEPEKIIETIRSRTQQIYIKAIQQEEIKKALIKQRGIDEQNATRIARMANGNWLKALEELDSENEKRHFLELFISLMRLTYTKQLGELKTWSENVASLGREKQKRMMEYFLHMVRENFMYNFNQPQLSYMTQDEENFASKFAPFINEANVIQITEQMQRTIPEITQNANPKILFYDMALQLIILIRKK
ncbi:DNA polymerase III subunit delta [Prevotella sp. Rep29]|uniref:DNA polymerase III subunit n=1 Tax=Prevotella sp. Rep29 TaxID=2691580 RepID=UPI001C6EE9EA|nr:DNA polymerase III subunit delta [Prevotella sp. Rep29]QYR09932.1 DNA polymerase III subunit delta [Prevotella sp. Rep29]